MPGSYRLVPFQPRAVDTVRRDLVGAGEDDVERDLLCVGTGRLTLGAAELPDHRINVHVEAFAGEPHKVAEAGLGGDIERVAGVRIVFRRDRILVGLFGTALEPALTDATSGMP